MINYDDEITYKKIFITFIIVIPLIFKMNFIIYLVVICIIFGIYEYFKEKMIFDCKKLPLNSFNPNETITKDYFKKQFQFYKKYKILAWFGNPKVKRMINASRINLCVGIYNLGLQEVDDEFKDYTKVIEKWEQEVNLYLKKSHLIFNGEELMKISMILDYICYHIINTNNEYYIKKLKKFTQFDDDIVKQTAKFAYSSYIASINN